MAYILLTLFILSPIVILVVVVYRSRQANKRLIEEEKRLLEEERQKIESGEYEYRIIRVWPDFKHTGVPLDFPERRVLVKKGSPRLKGEFR